MMGGGYVLSADLAAVILGINQQSRGHDLLKFMPNEDVSVGFWLMSVDMRRIDHQRVVCVHVYLSACLLSAGISWSQHHARNAVHVLHLYRASSGLRL